MMWKNLFAFARLTTPLVVFITKEIGIWSDKDLPYPVDMPFQWTFVTWFMYLEVGIIFFLLLPFLSPSRWQRIFRSRFLTMISEYSHIYFNMFIAVLLLLFIDSIREMRKYNTSTKTVDLKNNLETEHLAMIKLFWAQRNYYISGFALFLWFIIRRLMTLINNEAELEVQREFFRLEAKKATEIANHLAEDKNTTVNKDKRYADLNQEESLNLKLDQSKDELDKTKEELKNTKVDFETLRSQACSTRNDFDRLLKEHENLQQEVVQGNSKKEN